MKKTVCRLTGLFLTAALGASMLASCTQSPPSAPLSKSGGSAPTSSIATDPTDLKADLRFSWWGGDARHTATTAALDIFKTIYPGVNVSGEYQGYDGYHDKMYTQLAGSTSPDLFQYNPENIPEIAETGKLLVLNEYIDSGLLDLSNVSDSTLVDTTIDGKIYGIPMSTQTICVIYNKTLFDNAKVAVPKDDWTWADYDAMIKELAEKLPEGIYPSTDLRVGDITLLAQTHQNGGAYVTPDGKLDFAKAIREPLETFQKYMKDGLVPNVETSLSKTNDTLFMEGKAAIHATFNAMASSLQSGSINKDEYVLTSIPGSNTGDKKGMYVKGEVAFCISADSKNIEAAVTLLSELINNEEMGKALGLSRGIPPSENVRNILKTDMSSLDIDVFKVQAMAEASNDIPEPRLMKGWMDVMGIIVQELDEYRYERKDIDTTIADMVKRAQIEFDNAQ